MTLWVIITGKGPAMAIAEPLNLIWMLLSILIILEPFQIRKSQPGSARISFAWT